MDTASSSTADPGGSRSREAGALRRGLGEARALLGWLAVVAATTTLLWFFRGTLKEAHTALAYLLLVLGASARNGRLVGLTLAVVSFLTFNFFLLPPYYTFAIADPLDWWLLIAFLITGAVAAELFHRTQRAVRTAGGPGRWTDCPR